MDLRTLLNDKQVVIAHKVGVTQACVSKWVNKQSIPNQSTMQKLAEVLNVDLVTILACFYGEPKEIEI